MPQLPAPVSGFFGPLGGGLGYPSRQLQEEVARLAYYFHWPLEQILDFNHVSRRQWLRQLERLAAQPGPQPPQ